MSTPAYPDPLAELLRGAIEPETDGPHPPPGAATRRIRAAARQICLVLIGFLLAVAYHQMTDAGPATSKARANLLADVRDRRAEADRLQRHADALGTDLTRRRNAQETDTDPNRLVAADAGFVAVSGAGVTVRLTDAKPRLDPITGKPDPDNPGAVLDRDLQDIANALWRLGAEAIAINGHRLAATTTIRAAGGTILVDYRPVTSPYQVTAIGGDLADRFAQSAIAGRFRRYADGYRMGWQIKPSERLTLPAAGQPRLHYATPAPSSSGGRS